jgi:hypothetical protein
LRKIVMHRRAASIAGLIAKAICVFGAVAI